MRHAYGNWPCPFRPRSWPPRSAFQQRCARWRGCVLARRAPGRGRPERARAPPHRTADRAHAAVSFSACESARMPSRSTSPSCCSRSLPTNADRSAPKRDELGGVRDRSHLAGILLRVSHYWRQLRPGGYGGSMQTKTDPPTRAGRTGDHPVRVRPAADVAADSKDQRWRAAHRSRERDNRTPQGCAPVCTIGCVDRVWIMDFWRDPQAGLTARQRDRR